MGRGRRLMEYTLPHTHTHTPHIPHTPCTPHTLVSHTHTPETHATHAIHKHHTHYSHTTPHTHSHDTLPIIHTTRAHPTLTPHTPYTICYTHHTHSHHTHTPYTPRALHTHSHHTHTHPHTAHHSPERLWLVGSLTSLVPMWRRWPIRGGTGVGVRSGSSSRSKASSAFRSCYCGRRPQASASGEFGEYYLNRYLAQWLAHGNC